MANKPPRRNAQQHAQNVQEAPETVNPDEETTQPVPQPQEPSEGAEGVNDGEPAKDSGSVSVDEGPATEEEPVVVPEDEGKVHVTPELKESLENDKPTSSSEMKLDEAHVEIRNETPRQKQDREAQEAFDAEWPKTVTTTMEPNREIEVFPKEYSELQHQGLIKTERKPGDK